MSDSSSFFSVADLIPARPNAIPSTSEPMTLRPKASFDPEVEIYDVTSPCSVVNIPPDVFTALASLHNSDILTAEVGDFLEATTKGFVNIPEDNFFKLYPDLVRSLRPLNSEQREYLFNTKAGSNKEEMVKIVFERSEILASLGQIVECAEQEQNCRKWLAVAFVGEPRQPYGAVFLFQNPSTPKSGFMQGISKFAAPMIAATLEPEALRNLPKLNEILLPRIETLAKSLGMTEINVNPIGKQGDILEKHYGFNKLSTLHRKPCKLVQESFEKSGYQIQL